MWVTVWWVCVPTGFVVGVRLCAPGLCMHLGCGHGNLGSMWWLWVGRLEYAHVYHRCTTSVWLCTFAIYCSGWAIWTRFGGNIYLCKSGFLPEVQMFAEKHCPPMPAPEPFASVTWEGVKNKDPWAPVQTNSESAGLGPRNLDYSTCFTGYRCRAVFEDHGSGPTFLFFLLRRLRPRKVCGLSKDTGLRRGRSRTKLNPF